MGGLILFVTEGLPEAQGEEHLGLFGMRLDKMEAKKKKLQNKSMPDKKSFCMYAQGDEE